LVLLLVVIAIPSGDSGNIKNTTDVKPKVLTRAVVIARNPLPAGAKLENSYLTVEERPEATLPDDAIESVEEVLGKITLGPIPANYPLSRTLVSDAEQLPEKKGLTDYIKRTRVQTAKRNTVAVALSFRGMSPVKGQRVALSVQGTRGGSVLVVDDAWVEDVNEDVAYVRVSPATALFLEEAKSLGKISYLVIPDEGTSPYDGQAVANIFELRKKLGLDVAKEQVAATSGKQANRSLSVEDFQSFAWIPGGEYLYGVSDGGRIHVITENGDVSTLQSHRLRFPNWTKKQKDSVANDSTANDSTTVDSSSVTDSDKSEDKL